MKRNYKTIVDKAAGQRALLRKQIKEKEIAMTENKLRQEALEKARAFLQTIAQETQEQLKIHVEDIVQLALDTCFPDKYQFIISFEVSRGVTTAVMSFLDIESGKSISPMDASGGGVVDLASFALRIAAWTLEGRTDNVIILDEPMKFLSRDLILQAAKVMKTLSEKLNLQFIMSTHIPELIDIADTVYQVAKNKQGVSKARKLKNGSDNDDKSPR